MNPKGIYSFLEFANLCINSKEFLAEFDRLNGTNLSCHGTPIQLAIDSATGRQEKEYANFFAISRFC